MKKYIIAAAIVLTSGITALSFTKKQDTQANVVKLEKAHFAQSAGTAKSDIATAD